jgi:hypothetical protein
VGKKERKKQIPAMAPRQREAGRTRLPVGNKKKVHFFCSVDFDLFCVVVVVLCCFMLLLFFSLTDDKMMSVVLPLSPNKIATSNDGRMAIERVMRFRFHKAIFSSRNP